MTDQPPTLHTFNHQVNNLAQELGVDALCGPSLEQAEYTLFVEDGRVIAKPKGSPRHPYGLHCSLPSNSTASERQKLFRRWLETGEAYREFLAMNVCRYNC